LPEAAEPKRPDTAQQREEIDMLRNRRQPATEAAPRAFADFHQWVLSLPWIVERPYSLGSPGVRCFGVDCPPLGRKQMWLLTGLQGGSDAASLGLAVIVPTEAALELEDLGWGRTVAPMPVGHALVTVSDERFERREELEALVLTAYGYAMS
jgi:hypothetical protein